MELINKYFERNEVPKVDYVPEESKHKESKPIDTNKKVTPINYISFLQSIVNKYNLKDNKELKQCNKEINRYILNNPDVNNIETKDLNDKDKGKQQLVKKRTRISNKQYNELKNKLLDKDKDKQYSSEEIEELKEEIDILKNKQDILLNTLKKITNYIDKKADSVLNNY
ncbi:hypothetical protein EIN_502590 [Entamoeba invadens IP1]|uniref:Uncharacterized protein n=1 Tax=Entamoeba invadens IP1 TaxID=370355 RepID=A0A0A1TXA7_ENTIV|nr:hypothetical protein EIN_502590 [Entamoeba invadens IP1]ELP84116.1 hypothetical protein EIN_502590 [Entamoeba invadens IP1]|eukprot:XP_004183462.1 hypothetical protein EIN_502590 [Entamoeba invadens IP1]